MPTVEKKRPPNTFWLYQFQRTFW